MSIETVKYVLTVAARMGVEAFASKRNITDEAKRQLMKAMEEAASSAVDSVFRIAAIFHRKENDP